MRSGTMDYNLGKGNAIWNHGLHSGTITLRSGTMDCNLGPRIAFWDHQLRSGTKNCDGTTDCNLGLRITIRGHGHFQNVAFSAMCHQCMVHHTDDHSPGIMCDDHKSINTTLLASKAIFRSDGQRHQVLAMLGTRPANSSDFPLYAGVAISRLAI